MKVTAGIGEAACCKKDSCCSVQAESRSAAIRDAVRLEYLTLGLNVIESVASLISARISGSVAILGFGIDSVIECASAAILLWRLRAERDHYYSDASVHRIEHRARKLVAVSLLLLGGYVVLDAIHALWTSSRPSFTYFGVTVLTLSILVMVWLARAKKRLAHSLESQAMHADATQTLACWWLSAAALVALGLNGALGWWWADPLAAFVIAALIFNEGRDAWLGKSCC